MSIEATEQPPATFYVIAYQQERFIRQAVAGAFSQTYSPLEIILSDDCSADRTFEIMQEMAKDYRGPHTVVLNRNPINLGLSAHVNQIMKLASGELIVASDGDDFSFPQRTSRCVQVWLENGKPAALCSGFECIDAEGNAASKPTIQFAQFLPSAGENSQQSLQRFVHEGTPMMISCSGAWSRTLFETFGPIHAGLWFEDNACSFRAWLLNRIVFIRETLSCYRQHESNLVNREPAQLRMMTRPIKRQIERDIQVAAGRNASLLRQYLHDLDFALTKKMVAVHDYEKMKAVMNRQLAGFKAREQWWDIAWFRRVALLPTLWRSGRKRELLAGAARLLPLPIFLAAATIWWRLRKPFNQPPARSHAGATILAAQKIAGDKR